MSPAYVAFCSRWPPESSLLSLQGGPFFRGYSVFLKSAPSHKFQIDSGDLYCDPQQRRVLRSARGPCRWPWWQHTAAREGGESFKQSAADRQPERRHFTEQQPSFLLYLLF